jgi:NAD(P)H-flavin reductase/ferredoxin
MSPRVRFEPLGEEIDCAVGETVLDAAFRHGYNLVYGCREGQCSACKSLLLEGEVALRPYSSFALSDSEAANGYSLLCRAMPETDLVVELLHYDPDGYRLAFPIREGTARVRSVESLTPEISRVVLTVEEPSDFSFVPGQYVDVHVPGEEGARRSFSLANTPGDGLLELVIRRYPGGRISGLLDGAIAPGTELRFTGPYGAFHLRASERPVLMVAAGSGMAPILAMLRQLAAEGCPRPVRCFYGARTEADVFAREEVDTLGSRFPDFRFTAVFSGPDGRHVQDAVDEYLAAAEIADPDAYLCGPPAMVEETEAMLVAKHQLDEQRIFSDKFTASAAGLAVPVSPIGLADERAFTWYQPHRRRATLYEDVTIDTQPSIHRHLARGWPVHFEDGRGTWNDASTALRSRDWFEFRDPGEQWERPFYQRGAAIEVQLEATIRSAIEEGLIDDFSPQWVEFLRAFLQGPAFVEHGLWFAMATAARDCLSDSVATCVCLQAAMKQRSAQAIVLYAMDLEHHLGDFSTAAAKASFLAEEAWQPTRRYLERLAATPDWGEVIVASNLCLEPVLGTLIRRELGTRAAAASGDTVTTELARAATQEWEWIRAWSTALSRFLLDDPVHGAANRAVIAGWVEDWMPEAVRAALALAPAAGAVARVREYARDVLVEAGLSELGEVPARDPGPERAAVALAPTPLEVTAPVAPMTNGTPSTSPTFDYVGIVMAKSAEGDAVAAVLGRRGDVQVIDQPAFWELRAEHRLVIPFDAVSEQLGYEIDAYSIQHEMSTHYGRMVATDDALMLFSDPTEAMEHLMS